MSEGRSSIVITVFSTTSGIGKTVVATNLAAGLASEGYAVCLVDLDLQYGDVANYLRLPSENLPTILDAQSALYDNPNSFDSRNYLCSYRHGDVSFSVLLAPHKIEQSYELNERAVMSIINSLDYFNFIIVDTKAEFSDINMAVMDISTIINFLCVADFVPAIKNLKNGYEAVLRFGYDINKVRLVLNRSDSQTLIDAHEVEVILGKNFYHQLCNDFRSTNNSIQSGCPLILSDSNCRLEGDIDELVGLYTNRPKVEKVAAKSSSGIASFFKKIFRR